MPPTLLPILMIVYSTRLSVVRLAALDGGKLAIALSKAASKDSCEYPLIFLYHYLSMIEIICYKVIKNDQSNSKLPSRYP
jgi:hypothetical protein